MPGEISILAHSIFKKGKDMINHFSSSEDEKQLILDMSYLGYATCKSSIFQLLHALISIVLAIVNIMNSIVDFTIGILTIIKCILRMASLLLSLHRDVLEQEAQLAILERRRK